MLEETTAFEGRIGEVIHIHRHNGQVFEQYRRPPGVRLIIVSPDNKILITQEHRHENDGVDLRLPGGKVCNSLRAWRELKASGEDLIEAGKAAAIAEAREETGLDIKSPEFIVKANAGSTVEWDLYYYLVCNYMEHPEGQNLEQGEDITVTWMSADEIRPAIAAGRMQEWRSAGVLLGMVFPKLGL